MNPIAAPCHPDVSPMSAPCHTMSYIFIHTLILSAVFGALTRNHGKALTSLTSTDIGLTSGMTSQRHPYSKCQSCGFLLAELAGYRWCINHDCDLFEKHLTDRSSL